MVGAKSTVGALNEEQETGMDNCVPEQVGDLSYSALRMA